MKPKKTDPMKRFLKQHPFLAETERIHRLVDEAVGTPEPIQLPERAVTKTLTEKLPILQQETYRRRMVRAVYLMQEEVFARIVEADVPPLMQESAREYLAVLKKLRKAAKEEFIIAVLTQDKEAFAALCEQHALNEGFIRSTIWRMIAALVPAELKEPDGWNPDRDRPRFRENYCPVCGRLCLLRQRESGEDAHARTDGQRYYASRYLRCVRQPHQDLPRTCEWQRCRCDLSAGLGKRPSRSPRRGEGAS